MGQRIEVCRAGAVAHPQPFLSRRLKAGIVTLTLCTQGVCSLETEAAAVNGKPVIRGDDPVFNATPVFLPVIPVFVVTRASTGFGLTEGAAEFLPGTIIVGGFAIFVHSQSSITDQVTCRKSFALGIAFFEGDKSFPIIDRFHGAVDAFRIVALIREKGTPLQREDLVGCGEDVNGNCGIHDVGLGGQLAEWQPGDAVHQHMAFVSPVELIPPLIVLVRGRMDAQSAVRVTFGVVFLGELAFRKGLRVVLLRVCHDGRGIQPDERRIHHAQLIQLPHQIGHDRLQRTVVQLPQAAVIRPIGRQRLHDVKAAVMGDDAVVVQIIHQICDLRETLAFHNDKRTDHGFFGEAPPPGCRSGQREVQTAEKLVVEVCGSLGCEQRDILNDFLPVDSGQPLSGWCVSQIHFTRMGRRFLYQWSDFRLQP